MRTLRRQGRRAGLAAVTLALMLGLEGSPAAAKDFLVVAGGASFRVGVVDTATWRVIRRIPVEVNSHGMAVSRDGRFYYLGDMEGPGAVTVVDAVTHQAVKTIPVGGQAFHLAMRPDGAFLYVTVFTANRVAVIETASHRVVTALDTGKGPNGVIFSGDGKWAYVSHEGEDTVAVLDAEAHRMVAKVNVGSEPTHLALSPDGRKLYVSNKGSEDMSVVDLATRWETGRVGVRSQPHGIVALGDGRVLVANLGAEGISVVDVLRMQEIGFIQVKGIPQHLALSPEGRTVLVNLLGSERILLLDAATLQPRGIIPLGFQPHQGAFGSAVHLAAHPKGPGTPAYGAYQAGHASQARTHEAGGIRVKMTYLTEDPAKAKVLRFRLVMETHTVDLNAYDPAAHASLRADGGPWLPAKAWENPKGTGHHRRGILVFSNRNVKGAPMVTRDTKILELRLRNLGGVGERIFRWTLAPENLGTAVE